MKVFAGLLTIFISIPIWYYLFYKILQSVGASELMWFLFWIYVPVTMVASLIAKALDE